jgi:Xaa-Pro aminopeptidase
VEFKERPIQVLSKILAKNTIRGKRIGIELRFLPALLFEELNSFFSGAEFVDVAEIFYRLRMVKDEKEIETLRLAAYATRKAIEDAFAISHAGTTEKEISKEIIKNLSDQGADEINWTSIETGARSMCLHALTSDVPLNIGDIVRVDCGALFRGYYSDVARTYAVGKPSKEQERIYRFMSIAEREVIKHMRPGVRCCDLYEMCKSILHQNDVTFNLPHIGHGLGVDLHDEPVLSPVNESILEENMVINVEPVCVEPNKATYHIEDLVRITKGDPEILTGQIASEQIPVI